MEDEKLLIVCNFSEETIDYPEDIATLITESKKIIIQNYKDEDSRLRPYEAIVYEI